MKQNSTLKRIPARILSIYAGLTLLLLMLTQGLQAQTVKEYTSAEADALKADLIAGTYDIYELATEAGTYVITGSSGTLITINKSVTIRAKAGLTVKPILSVSNSSTSSTSAILIPSLPDLTITLQGIECNGLNAGAGSQPILIKSATTATNCKIIIKDCYIHHFANASGNGTIRLDASSGSSMDIQGNTFDNCYGRILYFGSADADVSTANGDITLRNNTFSNITGTVGNPNGVIHFKSTSSVPARGVNATIDHCTFYKFTSAGTDEIFKFRSMTGVINITNCIFDQISLGITFAAPAPVFDYCYLAGFATPPTGTNTVVTALPGYTNAAALNFGLVNVTGFTGSDAKTIGDTRYYGTPTSVKGPVQLSGNGKSSFRSYPNPVSEKITFDYTLDKSSNVRISVYNLSNQLVKSYMNNEPHGAGSYSRSFDVSDLKTGVYFVRMTTGKTSKTVKVVVKR